MSRTLVRACAAVTPLILTFAACSAPGSVTGGENVPLSASRVDDAPEANSALTALRQVTSRFQRFEQAEAGGYSTRITPCWAHHSSGAMGYHYGNTNLFDATVDLLAPEVLMYEPQKGGHLKLVGMEYIVPIDAWKQAGHDTNNPADRPELLGQKFTPHSFLPIYKLHIWLWRNNPQGTFADWNPKVSCASADSTEVF
jgi:hypothetical protein